MHCLLFFRAQQVELVYLQQLLEEKEVAIRDLRDSQKVLRFIQKILEVWESHIFAPLFFTAGPDNSPKHKGSK